MVASEFIKVRVPLDVKQRVARVAERECLSESAWLRRLVLRQLLIAEGADAGADRAVTVAAPRSVGNRVHIRLRTVDHLLLHARAEARGMRPATYVSVLTRSHLRRMAPLPKDELLALRRSIVELAALGRNINQIARAANTGGRLPNTVRDDFRVMLKICEGLRDHTKALLKANLASWECA